MNGTDLGFRPTAHLSPGTVSDPAPTTMSWAFFTSIRTSCLSPISAFALGLKRQRSRSERFLLSELTRPLSGNVF